MFVVGIAAGWKGRASRFGTGFCIFRSTLPYLAITPHHLLVKLGFHLREIIRIQANKKQNLHCLTNCHRETAWDIYLASLNPQTCITQCFLVNDS